MEHPALKRSWLQTGGAELSQVHRTLRKEFDQAHEAQYMGAGMFKLFNESGAQVGIIQFQGERQSAADDAMEAIILQEATGVEPEPDPLAGDTIIRPLDLSDAGDAALAAKALSGKEPAYVIMDDIERMEVPPINLPDYQAPDKIYDANGWAIDPLQGWSPGMNVRDPEDDDGRGGTAVVGYLVMAILALALIAAGFGLYHCAKAL